jgi:2-methylisocitrate lyase-like PEP mutase family enzyme
MVQKVRAAVDARRDPDFVIEARTDAAGPVGLDEAIRRSRQYLEAGADLVFADALLSEVDIARFCSSVGGPVAVNMGFGIRRRSTTPLVSAGRLQELGAAAVIYPRLLTSAALSGMRRAIEALIATLDSGQVVDRSDLTVSFEELNSLMGLGVISEMEERYLTPEQLERKYGARAARLTSPGSAEN